MSLRAIDELGLDEVWWLVSPQNPLKPRAGMAPMEARLASARTMARGTRIRATDIETRLGTTHTCDTLKALCRRYPHVRFLWMMGADNLAQFHQWRRWRDIARTVPIVVFARPPYTGRSQFAPAMGWLRRFVRKNPAGWRNWHLPAIAILNLGLDHRSATAIRKRSPGWARKYSHAGIPQNEDHSL